MSSWSQIWSEMSIPASINSISQSWIFKIKSLQDPLRVGSKLRDRPIDDDVREWGPEQKCFRRWRKFYRDVAEISHIVRQTVPNGRSGDWKGLVADVRQFDGQHQQTKLAEQNEGNANQVDRLHELVESKWRRNSMSGLIQEHGHLKPYPFLGQPMDSSRSCTRRLDWSTAWGLATT